MVQALCTSGNHEVLKCGVHGAAGLIAGLMAAYNIAACCYRTDRHLRVRSSTRLRLATRSNRPCITSR